MAEKRSEKEFLRERGLARAYASYKRIKRKPKRVLITQVSRFDAGVVPTKIYVLREHGRTVFRDFQTLKRLAESKRSIPQAIRSLFSAPVTTPVKETVLASEKAQFGEKGTLLTEYENRKPKRAIVLKYLEKSYTYYPMHEKLRTRTVTNKAFRKSAVGMVVVDVTYSKGNQVHRGVYRSAGGFILSSRSQVREAIVSAIHNGLHRGGAVNFSPTDIIVHDYWFEYFRDEFNVKLRPTKRYPRGSSRLVTARV